MRLFKHWFDGDHCEAPDCPIRTRSLFPAEGGWVRACCLGHVEAADRRLRLLSELEAREIEAESPHVEGELPDW